MFRRLFVILKKFQKFLFLAKLYKLLKLRLFKLNSLELLY